MVKKLRRNRVAKDNPIDEKYVDLVDHHCPSFLRPPLVVGNKMHLCLLGRFTHPMLHVGGQIPVQAGPEREDHFYDVQLLVLFEHLLQHDLNGVEQVRGDVLAAVGFDLDKIRYLLLSSVVNPNNVGTVLPNISAIRSLLEG
ncbi:hypothetical protein quinque_002279 [Culex quinquefasciatus]